jgi:adenylate cyclase
MRVASAKPDPFALRLSPDEFQALRVELSQAAPIHERAGHLLHRFLQTEVVNGVLRSVSFDDLLGHLLELASTTLAAERSSIFLHDADADELFAYVAQGGSLAEIRIPRTTGIAGAVFQSGEGVIVPDAYRDPRFNPTVDERTGYRSRSVVCVPLRDGDGRILGVFETLNKREGGFEEADLALLQAIADHVANAVGWLRAYKLQSHERSLNLKLLEASEYIAMEIDLDRLLERIAATACDLLDCERATIFLHDVETNELWSRIVSGGAVSEIRIPSGAGIAGTAFKSREVIAVDNVHIDARFDASVDARTGFVTNSLLCVPIVATHGVPVGVLEVLNKRNGRFSSTDERGLRLFASQAAVVLQNSQLLADVLSLKQYTDSILRSLTDGVVTFDQELRVVRANDAAHLLLRITDEEVVGESAEHLWGIANPWLRGSLAYVLATGATDFRPEAVFIFEDGQALDVNTTVAPLKDNAGRINGVSLVLQDISREKKVRTTMTRYMAKQFAERVLADGAETVSSAHTATVLFSDIRRFTSHAETLTPQEVVEMLNEYFGEMAAIAERHGGAIDKFIGDALMVVFGAPIARDAAAASAVQAAVEMVERLEHLNRRRMGRGAKPLEIGVGIASGDIVAGPLGSATRVDYTVIGDTVNLASRLEGVNRQYGTTILVDAATAEALAPSTTRRTIDFLRVKGKENPTQVFEITERTGQPAIPAFSEFIVSYEEGITLYRRREWAAALRSFSAALKIVPNDGPSWVYTDRCLYYRDHPPPPNWDGIWTLNTK